MNNAPPDPDLPLPLQQHPNYAATMALLGRQARFVTLQDGSGPLAHALVLQGILPLPMTLRGPVWSRPVCHDVRTETLGRMHLRLIEAETEEPCLRRAGFYPVTTPGHTAELSVLGDKAERWRRMNGKWRNALRKAETTGIKLEHRWFKAEHQHPLLDLCRAQAKARRYRMIPHRFTFAYAEANPKQARLFTARKTGQDIAYMLFLIHAPMVTYHLGWSGPEGRQCNAHHLLLSHAADWFAQRGMRSIDLGLVDTETAPGLARFKIGSGAIVRPLGGSWLRLRKPVLATTGCCG